MTYQPKKEPWTHQAEALRRLDGQGSFALLMAMRTGKTKVVLDDFGRLEDAKQVDDLLVIAPAGVYETWFTAADEHVAPDLLSRMMRYVWRSGEGRTGEIAREIFLRTADRPRMLIVNVEALSAVERCREMCLKFLCQRPGRSMTVVDESTIIKNPSANRTKFAVRKLAPLSRYRRILSGLPAPRSPLDLFSQFQFLDPRILGHASYYSFRARYAIMRPMMFGGRTIQVPVGYQNVDELHELIAPHSYRVRLEDCYDVPEDMYAFREVPLTSEQLRIYASIKQYATAELAKSQHVSATQVITQMLRMHQVLCGHVGDEQGNLHEVPENRTQSLVDYLFEYDGKAIIWCSYDYNVEKVSAALRSQFGDGSVSRFWGGNRSTREAEEKQFREDPERRFMVATPAAGGRGRTWTVANLMVYFSNTDNLEHRDQSEERARGHGKRDPVLRVDMIARGTVEERIVKALRAKIDLASTINGDEYREWLV